MTAAAVLKMPEQAEVSVRALVRQVMDETDLIDPAEIAGEILRRLPKEDVQAALEQTLPGYVRVVMHQAFTPPPKPSTKPGRSVKREGIVDIGRALRDGVHCATGWKHLADCTKEDLLFAVHERLSIAEKNRAKAEQFQTLVTLVTKHKVEVVADLPQDVLAMALKDWS